MSNVVRIGRNAVTMALDLGTKTGWAISKNGHVISGTENLTQSRFQGGGYRFLQFDKWFTRMYEEAGIDQVYFEEVRGHKGTDAAHIYGGFKGMLTAICEEEGIPYSGVPVGTIKKFMTGKGNAGKDAMIQAVRDAGYDPVDDNEADAIALLLWSLS